MAGRLDGRTDGRMGGNRRFSRIRDCSVRTVPCSVSLLTPPRVTPRPGTAPETLPRSPGRLLSGRPDLVSRGPGLRRAGRPRVPIVMAPRRAVRDRCCDLPVTSSLFPFLEGVLRGQREASLISVAQTRSGKAEEPHAPRGPSHRGARRALPRAERCQDAGSAAAAAAAVRSACTSDRVRKRTGPSGFVSRRGGSPSALPGPRFLTPQPRPRKQRPITLLPARRCSTAPTEGRDGAALPPPAPALPGDLKGQRRRTVRPGLDGLPPAAAPPRPPSPGSEMSKTLPSPNVSLTAAPAPETTPAQPRGRPSEPWAAPTQPHVRSSSSEEPGISVRSLNFRF